MFSLRAQAAITAMFSSGSPDRIGCLSVREYDKTLHTSSTEASVRPNPRKAGAKPRVGAAHGTTERADKNRGLMFKLGYLLSIVLVALAIVLPILFILGID